jgi:hypothetical protein
MQLWEDTEQRVVGTRRKAQQISVKCERKWNPRPVTPASLLLMAPSDVRRHAQAFQTIPTKWCITGWVPTPKSRPVVALTRGSTPLCSK